MRWLVVSLLLSAVLYFSFWSRFIAQPADAPNEEKVSRVVIPKRIQPDPVAPQPQDDPLRKSMEDSRAALKNKGQLKTELAENPHGTPPALIRAGLVLGEIAELEAQYPERKEEFTRYYRECFESSETITVTRVQCLKRYIRSAKLDGTQRESVVARLPDPVQRLYKRSEAMQ